MTRDLVWQLLRRNISKLQLFGYALASVTGLAIVLGALQFYLDISSAMDSDDSFVSRDYVIISKRVGVGGSLFSGSNADFSADDIADIEAQPWVRRVGRFTSAGYNVSGAIELGGRRMSTYLFFESIPDEFFDSLPSHWDFDPEHDDEIPIIISKDYLTLYNFGFASSRGMPQISEAMLGMVPLRISISGNGRQLWLKGRIAGFSSRLNTIAVPQPFMEWANRNFADDATADPSRLIIEVNSPGNPAIADYLREHRYESAGDKVDNGKAAYFLSVVTAVVVAVGIVISLLAFFILMLSIYLLIRKNRSKLRNLMMLGYAPSEAARGYCRMIVILNAVVLVVAIAIVFVAASLWRAPLDALGIVAASPWIPVAAGIVIMAVITIGNYIAIRRNIRRTFPRPQQ